MKKLVLLAAILLAVAFTPASAQIITLWDFNGASATTVPGGELSPTPSIGSGTASLIGGVTAAASFGSGTANGGSSDPVTTTPADYGWQTTTYAAAAGVNKSTGVQFNVPTVGFSNIELMFDVRHSNTSSRYERLQYSLDGLNFSDSLGFSGPAGDTWFNQRTVNLTGVAGVDNNPNFAFRIVSEWESTAGGGVTDDFVASNGTSTYAGTGTWRFDMVTVSSVPEPSVFALIGLGGMAVAAMRRFKRSQA